MENTKLISRLAAIERRSGAVVPVLRIICEAITKGTLVRRNRTPSSEKALNSLKLAYSKIGNFFENSASHSSKLVTGVKLPTAAALPASSCGFFKPRGAGPAFFFPHPGDSDDLGGVERWISASADRVSAEMSSIKISIFSILSTTISPLL